MQSYEWFVDGSKFESMLQFCTKMYHMNIHNPAFPEEKKNLRHISRKIQVIVSSVHDQPLAILKTLVTSFPNTCSQSVNKFYHESSTPQAIFTLFWFYKLKFFPDKCHESCCLIKKTYISGLVITAKFQDKKQNGY